MKDVNLKPYQKLFFTTLNYQKLEPVFNAEKLNDDFYTEKAYSILIVSGIADPSLMHKYLNQFSNKTEVLTFPDHHNYTNEDVVSITEKFEAINSAKKIVITTEKDAMRLKDLDMFSDAFKAALYYLPVKVKFLEDDGKTFNNKILNYVGENKSNRELHNRKDKK